jgi:hypothetical protein
VKLHGLVAPLLTPRSSHPLQVTSTHLISSRSGEGVAAVASKVARERKGRDVFVVGAANVGKSAFVRALLKEMSRWVGGCRLCCCCMWCVGEGRFEWLLWQV